jgi:phenylpropionate dioxygenase-like ring-hydroxylating dioxygenase large terminal subunit
MSADFNFFQHWYPLSPIEDLEPNRPTPVTILGKQLVIWKSSALKNYQVFLDQCPHRLAALSEGRIEEKTGTLMCSYHGWEFDDRGVCTRIPQAENPDLVQKNKENFCVVKFPTQEVNGLLWVWMDPNCPELAAKTPLPLSSQVDAEKGFVWSSLVRDLEYDWQTLIENVADPSHVPFAHHGVQGDREKAEPIPITISQSTRDMIEAKIDRRFKTTITFEPPCHLEYEVHFGETKQLGLITYCIPVAPGKSRIVAQFSRNFAQKLHRVIPRWWDHLQNRNLILDGDMVFLHYQERMLQQKQQSESWKTAYKMPTAADKLIIEFRNWFDKYSGGKLPWQEVGINPPDILPMNQNREQLLDRYHQHTQHCSSCRGALKMVQRWQFILLAYFAIVVSGVAVLPDSLRMQWGLPLIFTALVGLGIYSGLKFWLEPKFYFVDYIHALKK